MAMLADFYDFLNSVLYNERMRVQQLCKKKPVTLLLLFYAGAVCQRS